MRAYVLAKKAIQIPASVRADPRCRGVGARGAGRRRRTIRSWSAWRCTAWAGRERCAGCRSTTSASGSAPPRTPRSTSPTRPSPVAGLRLALARPGGRRRGSILAGFMALADARGEEVSYALQRLQRLRPRAAGGRVGRGCAAARRVGVGRPPAPDRRDLPAFAGAARCGAGIRGRGRAVGGVHALAGAEPGGYHWQVLEARRARGVAALLAHEPARAARDARRRLGAPGARGRRRARARSPSRPISSRRWSSSEELDDARR